MIIYRTTEDDVIQTGEEDFELQDTWVITQIGKIRFSYSMAGAGWDVFISDSPKEIINWDKISINDIEEPEIQEMIKQIFQNKIRR